MKCVITGEETYLKYKNIPITRAVLNKAKALKDESEKLVKESTDLKVKKPLTVLQAIGELAKAVDRKEVA
jgi:hypothetical protein